jgi:hypothetical protein
VPGGERAPAIWSDNRGGGIMYRWSRVQQTACGRGHGEVGRRAQCSAQLLASYEGRRIGTLTGCEVTARAAGEDSGRAVAGMAAR